MGVFDDERFVVGEGAFQGGQVFCGAHIAQSDADVAQEAAPLGALDGRAAEKFPEALVRQRKVVPQEKARRWSAGPARAWKVASWEACAKRFHGHASRQSSQP